MEARFMIFIIQLLFLIACMIQTTTRFQMQDSTVLPINDQGYVEECPRSDAPFKKFLWLFFDGLATDQAQNIINDFPSQSTTWYRMWNPGLANSANVYSSIFSGKSIGNIVGSFIESDTIWKSFRRTGMKVSYLGWSTPLVDKLNPVSQVFTYANDFGFSLSVMPQMFGETDLGQPPSSIHQFLNDNVASKNTSALMITGITDKMNHWHTKTGSSNVKMVEKLRKDMTAIKQWIDSNPDYLLLVSSDHGGDRYAGESLKQLHGPPDGGNEPFFLFYSPKLVSVSSGLWVNVTDMTPTLIQYFASVNIPTESVGRVHPWTTDSEIASKVFSCNAAQLHHLIQERKLEESGDLYQKAQQALNTNQWKEAMSLFDEYVAFAHARLEGTRDSYLLRWLIYMTVVVLCLIWIYRSFLPPNSLSLHALWEMFWSLPWPLAVIFVILVLLIQIPVYNQEFIERHFFATMLMISVALYQCEPDKTYVMTFAKIVGVHVLSMFLQNIVMSIRLIVCGTLFFQLSQYIVLGLWLLFDLNSRKAIRSRPFWIVSSLCSFLLLLHFFEVQLGFSNALYVSYHVCFLWIIVAMFSSASWKATLLYPVAYLMFALEADCFKRSFIVFVFFPTYWWLSQLVFVSDEKVNLDKPRHQKIKTFKLSMMLVTLLFFYFALWHYCYMGNSVSIDVNPDIPGIADQVAIYLRAGLLIGFHKAGEIIFVVLSLYRLFLLNLSHDENDSLRFPTDLLIPWNTALLQALVGFTLFEQNFFNMRHTMAFFTFSMLLGTMSLFFGLLLLPSHKIISFLFHKLNLC